MGMDKNEVQKLLKDKKLMDQVIKKAINNKEITSKLANDLAEDLAEGIKNDPNFAKKLCDSAISDPKFKEKLLKDIFNEIGDD